jgi:hypothetical protein
VPEGGGERTKEEYGEEIILSDFKIFYKAMLNKVLQYWLRAKHIDQCDKTESSKTYTYMIN